MTGFQTPDGFPDRPPKFLATNSWPMMNKTIQAMADTMKVLEKERDQSKLDELKLQEKVVELENEIKLSEATWNTLKDALVKAVAKNVEITRV